MTAAIPTTQTPDPKTQFIAQFDRFRTDPYGFVLFSYPWGKPNSFLACDKDGVVPSPDDWQIDVMEDLRAELEKRAHNPDEVFAAICIAVASGHGIGKTTLIAWLIHWFISCYPHPQIKVTAGTMSQLQGKTWRELAKWHKISLQFEWFTWTATKFMLKESPDTWYAEAIPWSEHNADAFAGTHERYVMVLIDEGSAVADIIYETIEGALTTYLCIWIVFGNPIRNTGRFKACFTRFRNWWKTYKVDSRRAKMANQAQIARWKDQYGEDSDFFRKRVRGEFPVQASNQLISEAAVDRCRTLVITGHEIFPIRITCDVARFGEDSTVIKAVQGRKILECIHMHGKDTVQAYTKVVECWNFWNKKADNITVFVDDIGVGGGVTDMLKRVSGLRIIPVDAGAQAKDEKQYINIRMEMWWDMAQAVALGIDMTALDNETFERLKQDLINIEYFLQPTSQRYQLESVADLKERSLPSPDYGTALALSFAYPVPLVASSSGGRFTKATGGASTLRRKRGS